VPWPALLDLQPLLTPAPQPRVPQDSLLRRYALAAEREMPCHAAQQERIGDDAFQRLEDELDSTWPRPRLTVRWAKELAHDLTGSP
jgi:hypothetical protein